MNDTHAAELFGSASVRTLHRLPPGEVLSLAQAGGRLSVLAHAVWLTRTGDRRDHVLRAGEAIDLPAGAAGTVLEAWGRDGATVVWHPAAAAAAPAERARRRPWPWRPTAPALRGAFGLAAVAAALAVPVGLFGPASAARTEALLARPAATIATDADPARAQPDGTRRAAAAAGRRAAGAA